jgi:hypothetical protein
MILKTNTPNLMSINCDVIKKILQNLMSINCDEKKILQNLMSINCDEIKENFPSIHESKLIAPKNEKKYYIPLRV